MQIDEVLNPTGEIYTKISLIAERCSDYINESDGLPLYKSLSSTYNNFHKVKVRKRKDNADFTEIFNETFEDELHQLRERSVFASGSSEQLPIAENEQAFYIFPIDGYRFMYSKEVRNSTHDYQTAFDAFFEEFGSEQGSEMMSELFKFTYSSKNLSEGIEQGSEIILYNIPYFYAIKTSSVEQYDDLLTSIADLM